MILNGNKKLTNQTAKKLQELTGIEADFLMGKKVEGYEPGGKFNLKDFVDKSSKNLEQLKIDQLISEWKQTGSRELTDHEIHEAVKKN